MNHYGVIMAGGGGTRFWPLSRNKKPKQLLNLSGRDLMINDTIDRILPVLPKENMYIVTNAIQAEDIRQATSGRVASDHILEEVAARNTAACILYAAVKIWKLHGDGVMCVFPADHYIKNETEFRRILTRAIQAAEETEALVTIGIEPTFPAVGYGYIRFEQNEQHAVKKVLEFKEKPDLETACRYVQAGTYLWNSGIFVWKVSTVLENFRNFLPEMYDKFMQVMDLIGTSGEPEAVAGIYPDLQSISIDYGLMERSPNVAVIPGEFGWSDVGSWDMLGKIHKEDQAGNIIIGDQINIQTANTTSYSSGKTIVTIGVKDLIIAETPDAVLVCHKDCAQDIKKVVDHLTSSGRTELL